METNPGAKYSLAGMLVQNNRTINIPMIQRDYVQGKANKKEVRIDFLEALIKYLQDGINKDLDFVYGYEKDSEFIPLDGQQRLTTLFLLHTYLSIISDNEDHWRSIISDGYRSKFTYSVRQSSNEFCNALISNGIDFRHYSKIKNEEQTLKEFVSNLHWYKLSWNFDPTVVSMINMLEEIHERFQEYPQFYNSLIDSENPVITFMFLDLKELQQGDELYIKMNARGKVLTAFENFKARLEEDVKELFKLDDRKWKILFQDIEIEVGTAQYFSFKIDSVWSNLFWIYRGLVGDKNTFDDELFAFIQEMLFYHFVETSIDAKELVTEILREPLDTYGKLKRFPLINRESILFLIEILDILDYDQNGIKVTIQNKYFDEEGLFKAILTSKIQNPDRIKFYAYLKFLLIHNGDKTGIDDWMRVVVNLVENTIINSQEMVVDALGSINQLLPYSKEILNYLSNNNKIDFFNSDQIIEERIKANIIGINQEFYSGLIFAEQGIFHKGQVGYLLEFADILDNVDFNTNHLINKESLKHQFKVLKELSKKSIALFSHLDENVDFLFERGILSYGNYLIKNGQRYNFSSSKSISNYDRDYSWKRMLKIDYSSRKNTTWSEKRDIFKTILTDSSFEFDQVTESLKKRVKDFSVKDWRFDFVHNPKFIDYCKQGFIFTHNDFTDIQLLNASQMNHLRMDYFVYKCWLECSLCKEKYPPFNAYLVPVKGFNEIPFITFNDFVFKKVHYKVQYYNMAGNLFHIRILKSKGINDIEKYDNAIQIIAKEFDFKWHDGDDKGYILQTKDFKRSKNVLNEFLLRLQNLKP